MPTTDRLSLPEPAITPALDPGFRPPALANRAFRGAAKESGGASVSVALEGTNGDVARFETVVFSDDHPRAAANLPHLERWLKFCLWSRGGWRVHYAGPQLLGENLQAHYAEENTGKFDANFMGQTLYERSFEIAIVDPDDIPHEKNRSLPLGRHLDGCRIGFDLGASDRKVAAVIDGETVYSNEVVWDPKPQTDPGWHYDQINKSLKEASAHLPRVDAIGGSSAGVYVDNQVRVASLFRGVAKADFNARVKPIFLDLQKEWDVPFDVVNDGEVTALAGAMSIGANGVLGIAMGSSEAGGYVTPHGNITPWLNELAFAPVDYNPFAPADEWSTDCGVGALYFSQQCTARLHAEAGIELDDGMPEPEKLKAIQSLMDDGDKRAAKIYHTIGTYLGYTLAHYADFYTFEHVLILGRVTSGPGGEMILKQAGIVMQEEFPELNEAISFHTPDETFKRHGQAMVAASLPPLKS
jgi:predicted NBD/HSP70 family sugar kinase